MSRHKKTCHVPVRRGHNPQYIPCQTSNFDPLLIALLTAPVIPTPPPTSLTPPQIVTAAPPAFSAPKITFVPAVQQKIIASAPAPDPVPAPAPVVAPAPASVVAPAPAPEPIKIEIPVVAPSQKNIQNGSTLSNDEALRALRTLEVIVDSNQKLGFGPDSVNRVGKSFSKQLSLENPPTADFLPIVVAAVQAVANTGDNLHHRILNFENDNFSK